MSFRVYIDNSLNPFLHLEQEKKFLYEDKNIETFPILYFYRNNPSVVLGNFQNPWIEANVAYCLKNNITLVRRFTGGGCVYHDEGNLNICYVGPKSAESKSVLTHLIKNFLEIEFADISIGPRKDLFLNAYKFSGSAFRETKSRTLHHVTLLMNANLAELAISLKSPIMQFIKKSQSIPSKRSQVMNLYDGRDLKTIYEWIHSFCKHHNLEAPVEIQLKDGLNKIEHNVFSNTPSFSLQDDHWSCDIEKGILKSLLFSEKHYSNLNIAFPCRKIDLDFLNLHSNILQKWIEWGLVL